MQRCPESIVGGHRGAMISISQGQNAAIVVRGLTKRFGAQEVLRGVDVSMHFGEVVALMGPNGSGKSTLIKSIVGLVRPDGGSIHVAGHQVYGDVSYRRSVGYMPQIARYPETLTVAELFHMLTQLRSECNDYDLQLFEQLNIGSFASKQLGVLSGGQRQRVGAALAWYFSPTILLLDEPTAGLDPISTETIKAKIARERAQGKCLVITTHNPHDALELADRLVYLYEGEIWIDLPLEQLLDNAATTSLMGAIAWHLQQESTQ